MSVVQHSDRLFTLRKRNRQNTAAYLAIFIHGGYQPTPPNSNVVGFSRPAFVMEDEEDVTPHLRMQLGAEFVIFPPTVTVPSVVGLNISDALTTLANVSLLGSVTGADAPPDAPFNSVLTQSIAAGTHVGQGAVIALTVQDLTLVPSLVGLTQQAALTALIAANLIGSVTTAVSIPPFGIVLVQSIFPATQVSPNTVVNITVSIGGNGFRVKAVTAGWYQGTYYNVGDVFDLVQAADFSDATLNYEIAGGEYTAGWMIQSAAQLTQDDGQFFFPAVDPNRRYVE
ncbi:MAG: hypothetical protein JWO52_7848 [Gammaproteobacteria bacterium]|nr:hypothetical protein [Gammaproteobacteria bacterium]